MYTTERQPNVRAILEMVQELGVGLGHHYDVIVIAKVSWQVIPPHIRELILAHSERGIGSNFFGNRLQFLKRISASMNQQRQTFVFGVLDRGRLASYRLLRSLTVLLFVTALLPAQDGQPKQTNRRDDATPQNALELIEGVRGGRHWVDAKTMPPLSPSDSLKALRIEPGYEVELVAAEPLVRDPVAIAFDRRGRMFVVEYGDYPTGPEDGGAPLSRVVVLDDRDGDGTVETRTVFADKLNFCHSLMPFQGGVLVGAKTQIILLRDTDGDDVADVREVLFDGFTPAHPQMQIGNPRWGMDNWIYLNYGPGKVTSSRKPGAAVEMPRKDFRFNPRTFEFEADSGMGQFGNTIDRWGNRFYCTNRNPIMTTLLPPSVLKRNPHVNIATAHYDVGKSGGDTRVYPLVQMKSNYLSHAGTHTSACGVTAYTGGLGTQDFRNSVFVCEPIGHLVTRSVIEQDGALLTARPARPKADFLASTDTWFRPASLCNGPDGALYLADMYRLWVEHPKFLPPEIAARLDWRAGEERGRIYRIVPSKATANSFAQPRTNDDMLRLLESANGWQQFLGHRLLIEQADSTAAKSEADRSKVVGRLRAMLRRGTTATARLHSLWVLQGLGEVTKSDVITALNDSDAHLRVNALKLCGPWRDGSDVMSIIAKLCDDTDASVRFQATVTLGDSQLDRSTDLLTKLATRDCDNEWFHSVLLTSLNDKADRVLTGLVSSPQFVSTASPARTSLLRRLANAIAVGGDAGKLSATMLLTQHEDTTGFWWRAALVGGLGDGLPRSQGDIGRTSLVKLITSPPAQLRMGASAVRSFLAASQAAARNRKLPIADRVEAVSLLAYQPFDEASVLLEALLQTGQPVELQLAAIDALGRNGSAEAGQIVLSRWKQLGPTVRSPALSLLLRRTNTTQMTLDAMRDGTMRTAVLSIDQRVRLLKHRDAAIRELATKLFGGAVSTNRLAVARKYHAALELSASSLEGAKVFKRICAKCHRVNGQGHNAGPDLSDVRNRSKLALLYDILDPNSKVEPHFTAYSITTVDGKLFNGLIVSESESAVVLRMPEGKQQTIGRNEIDEFQASNVSLMPEGIEKDVTPQGMANLLEFLKLQK